MLKFGTVQSLIKNTLFLFALATILLNSCKEDISFPVIPAIEFKEFVVYTDSAFIEVDFTDGDGNIGFESGDTLGQFEYSIDPFNKFHYNFYIDIYQLENNEWTLYDLTPSPTNPGFQPLYYRTPKLDPEGNDKNLEGSIRVKLSPFPPIDFSTGDTIRFEVQLADRNLNLSNKLTTDGVIVP